MPYYPSKSEYPAPIRSSKLNYRSHSNPLSPKISRNLFAVISKFEALDSFSGGYKIPSLRPAHLQLPRSARKGQEEQNPSSGTILSSEIRGHVLGQPRSRKVAVVEDSNIYASPRGKSPVSNKQSISDDRSQRPSLHEAAKIRTRANDEQVSPEVPRPAVPSPNKNHGEVTRPKSSVVEFFVKLYDGSSGNLGVSRPAKVQHVSHIPLALEFDQKSKLNRPQQRPQYPENSPFRKQNSNDDTRALSTPSTCQRTKPESKINRDPTSIESKNSTCSHHSASKRQYKIFDDSINPFLIPKSLSKPSIENSSPLISPKTRLSPPAAGLGPKHSAPKIAISPNHRLSQFHHEASEAVKLDIGPKIWEVSPEVSPGVIRGRSRIPRAMEPSTKNMQRTISDTIEALYSKKYTEKLPNKKEGHEDRLSNMKVRRRLFDVDGPGHDVDPACWKSRVADIKKILDGNAVGKTSILQPCKSLPKIKSTLPPKQSLKQCAPIVLLPQPTADASEATKLVTTILTVEPSNATTIDTLLRNRVSLPLFGLKKARANTGAIKEKIKLWERTETRDHMAKWQKKDMRASKQGGESIMVRTKAIERPSKSDNNLTEDKQLSSKEVYEILRMFQKEEDRDRLAKLNTDVAKRSVYAYPVSKRVKEAVLHQEMDGTPRNIGDMIVKEAECGLREPKPVRLVAMKKMLWLCREKAAAEAYKEKNRVLHSRRF